MTASELTLEDDEEYGIQQCRGDRRQLVRRFDLFRSDFSLLQYSGGDLFTSIESARLPMRYMASLFSAGNVDLVTAVYRKLIATACTSARRKRELGIRRLAAKAGSPAGKFGSRAQFRRS